MTGRALGLSLVVLVALPAAAAEPPWRLVDAVSACYYQRVSGTAIRCTAVATFERSSGERRMCTAYAHRYPGPVDLTCEPPADHLRKSGPLAGNLSLTSNPPYDPGFAETAWRAAGDLVVGCITPRSQDKAICSAPARP